MDSLAIIRQFLTDRIGAAPEKVVLEAELAELGVDSMLLLELMFEFEDHFDIKLSSDLKPPKTVGEMATTIDALVGKQKAAAKA